MLVATKTAYGKYNSAYHGAQVLLSYRAKVSDSVFFIPQIGVCYSSFNSTGYTEIGITNQNLTVNSKPNNNIQGIIGARVQGTYNIRGVSINSEIHSFPYQQLINNNKGKVAVQLNGMPSPFIIISNNKVNSLVNLGLSVNVKHK